MFCLFAIAGSGWFLWRDHLRGETFWLSCLLVTAVVGLVLYALRRIGSRCDKYYADYHECERAQRLRKEIERGQRYGMLVASSTASVLDAEGFSLAEGIMAGASNPAPGQENGRSSLSPQPAANGQDRARRLDKHFSRLVLRLGPTLMALADNIPCYLSLQCEAGLDTDEVTLLLRRAGGPFRRSFIPLPASGLLALDAWLNCATHTPSAFVVIAVQLAGTTAECAGEAAVGMVMTRGVYPTLPVLARIHRPQAEPLTGTGRALSRALLWARLEPKTVQHVWITGVDDEAYRDHAGLALRLPPQVPYHHLENVLGCTGIATPWLALAAAAEQCQGDRRAQLIVCHEAARQIWIGGVSPPTPSP